MRQELFVSEWYFVWNDSLDYSSEFIYRGTLICNPELEDYEMRAGNQGTYDRRAPLGTEFKIVQTDDRSVTGTIINAFPITLPGITPAANTPIGY